MRDNRERNGFRWANPAMVSFVLTLVGGTVFTMGLPVFAFLPGPHSAQAAFAALDRDQQVALLMLLGLLPAMILVSGLLGNSRRARIFNRLLAAGACGITAWLLFRLAALTVDQAALS